jgi:ATP synthase protein I
MRMDKVDQYRLNRQMLTRFVSWQIGVTLVFGFVSGRLGDIESVRSALAGGAIGVVTNLYMARSFLRGRGETSPGRLLGALYVSEALKVLLTAALFIIAIVFFEARFLPMMATYAATLFVAIVGFIGPVE